MEGEGGHFFRCSCLAGVGISRCGGDVHQRCTAGTVSTIRGLRVPSSFRLEPDAIRVPLRVLHFLYVSRPLLSPPVVSSLQVLALRSLFLHRHSTTRANPSWRCGPPKRGLVQSSTCLLKLVDALSSNFLAIHNITDPQSLGYSMTKIAIAFLAWIICSLAQAANLSGVPRVVDGDTLAIGATKVRLEGVDAPETDQVCLNANGVRWTCGERDPRPTESELFSRPCRRCRRFQDDT